MSFTVKIILGIIFIVMGLAFCGVAMYLGRPESVKKASIYKPSSVIFYSIGALTFAVGLVILIFAREISKSGIQLCALIYLALLTVIFSVFTHMIKGIDKK